MEIVFTCTNCQTELSTDDSGAGQSVVCPKCNTSIIVPDKSSSTTELKQTIRLMPFEPMHSSPAARASSAAAAPAAPAAPATAPASPPHAPPPHAPPPSTEPARPLHNAGGFRSSAPSAPRLPLPNMNPTPAPNQTIRAVVTDIDMPISNMMSISLKWAIACLPAFSLLFFVGVLLWKLLRWLLKL